MSERIDDKEDSKVKFYQKLINEIINLRLQILKNEKTELQKEINEETNKIINEIIKNYFDKDNKLSKQTKLYMILLNEKEKSKLNIDEIATVVSVIAEYNPNDIDKYISEKIEDGRKRNQKKKSKKKSKKNSKKNSKK